MTGGAKIVAHHPTCFLMNFPTRSRSLLVRRGLVAFIDARRYLLIQLNIYEGQLSTPKNHQRRRVDISVQLLETLRDWRTRERARWLAVGQPLPVWVFPSVSGTVLDASNVRKALNRMLRAAGLHERGPHQLRHSFASQLLMKGADIAYVAQQLGHKDAYITLKTYTHYLPEPMHEKAVDRLDTTTFATPEESQMDATIRTPAGPGGDERDPVNAVSLLESMVSRGGIEPPTRRLRVPSNKRKRAISE